MVVAVAGYGVSTPFPPRSRTARAALRPGADRKGSCPPWECRAAPARLRRARSADAGPSPRSAASVSVLAAEAGTGRFTEVTCRRGSKARWPRGSRS
ncbi:hypothetical protein [Streptomyces rochei]|uniref:hypothetical protein n=1 Tax=Streptomyces TaxID=1883 RepID=UPI0036C810BA